MQLAPDWTGTYTPPGFKEEFGVDFIGEGVYSFPFGALFAEAQGEEIRVHVYNVPLSETPFSGSYQIYSYKEPVR